MKELKDLEKGDWIYIEYGYSFKLFYVMNNDIDRELININSSSWLVNSFEIKLYKDIKQFIYLGKTKLKWYWKYLPWRDIICPYKRPKII